MQFAERFVVLVAAGAAGASAFAGCGDEIYGESFHTFFCAPLISPIFIMVQYAIVLIFKRPAVG